MAVAREFENLKGTVEGFCDCALCRDDVFVYALNRLAPRYTAQLTGEVVTNLNMDSDQERARISVVILQGLRVVMTSPRPGHP